MSLFEEELTYEIRACFFDVQNEVGYGLSEEPYHQALKLAFAQKGIPARSRDPVKVLYRLHPVHELRPDFVVGERVYRKLFTAAMSIDCALLVFGRPLVQPLFHKAVLDVCEADCLVAAERVVILIVSLKDGLERFDVMRCKSFLSNLGLKYGVVVNFGKDRLQVHGVSV